MNITHVTVQPSTSLLQTDLSCICALWYAIILRMNTLDIIYEDKALIICHKPAGIATQTRRTGQTDMESMLRNHIATQGHPPYTGIIHRLDQPVEGVMVFAKTQEAAGILSRQVREHSIGKHYYALVQLADCCSFSQTTNLSPEGTLTDYLSFDKKKNLASVVSPDNKDAKKAVLDYHVVSEHDGHALLDILLHTGRHHQIRIQLSHRGVPVCGDSKYGSGFHTMPALCSYRIVFIHPLTGKKMDYTVHPHNPLFDGYL